jgi:hypothetical protein
VHFCPTIHNVTADAHEGADLLTRKQTGTHLIHDLSLTIYIGSGLSGTVDLFIRKTLTNLYVSKPRQFVNRYF